uniref:Uncharacterized protein n=1 Tax=Tanacetum cinerariifolium TaxID=118510 RepID=A0A6L2MEJ1_TANCI|nr:hypothetical protein [Tanacetum cinerariifolium]
MAEQQTIKYAPQWKNMTVDNVIFQTNNMVGNFTYPPNVPTYKPIMKFLRNCPLYNAFTNYPTVVYQNFLREFWSTLITCDPFPSTDEPETVDPEKRPIKEFLIKFLVLNGQQHSTLDIQTFCSSTGLDYNNGALSKKITKPKSKRPPTKTIESPPKPTEGSEQSHRVSSGTIPNPQDLERNIQLASMGLPSTLNEGTHKSEPLSKSTCKPTPCLEGSHNDKDLRGNKPPADMEPLHTTDADLSGTGAKMRLKKVMRKFLLLGMTWMRIFRMIKKLEIPPPKQDHPAPSHVQESASDSSSPDLKRFNNVFPLTERYLTDKLLEASLSSLNRSSTTISDLYKGLNVTTQLLKEISNTVKDDLATNEKINEATKTFTRISSHVTETALKREISSLRQDTSEIKSMMTKIYVAFYDHLSLAPSDSVTPKHYLTKIQANVEGENATTTATKEPPSHTEGETEEPRLAIPISSIPSTVIPPTQPITSIIIHPERSQQLQRLIKEKGLKLSLMMIGNGYHKKDKIQAKPDKTERKMESVKKSKLTKVNKKVNPIKVKVKDRAKAEELLNGPTRTHQMGRVGPFTIHEDL